MGNDELTQDHAKSLVLLERCDLVSTADDSEWCSTHQRTGGMCLRLEPEDISFGAKFMLVKIKQGADSLAAIRQAIPSSGTGCERSAQFWSQIRELEHHNLIEVDRTTKPSCVTPTWNAYPQ